MKVLYIVSVFLVFSLSFGSLQADQDNRFVENDRMNMALLSNTGGVKIFYREDGGEINCRVEFLWNQETVEYAMVRVSKIAFSKQPLTSCLAKEDAKQLLLSTFEATTSRIFKTTRGL
ncbi:hypothetical protein [Thalassotalea sp. ND16A]|uniref:hypothetical protein n=1 Tax=Thalassotalea sp. ND16A TaxID=1535422 RepID=UPI00051A1A90|nr:hypothetical protein [Thalassotalea sp. ND16A]KGJ95729.1 hypothetical protein ND16A_1264 [Thalassotalea sp. ND16A]